jgi:hypothetical protein
MNAFFSFDLFKIFFGHFLQRNKDHSTSVSDELFTLKQTGMSHSSNLYVQLEILFPVLPQYC